MRSRKQEVETPVRPLDPLTQRVWVAALGRYGPPALVNPWNAYDGDYSDDSLVHFGLSIRRNWLNKANPRLSVPCERLQGQENTRTLEAHCGALAR